MGDKMLRQLTITALKDGLYLIGNDIFCTYPLKGTKLESSKVTYYYDPYNIEVTWTNSEGKRVDPHWVRKYPEEEEE